MRKLVVAIVSMSLIAFVWWHRKSASEPAFAPAPVTAPASATVTATVAAPAASVSAKPTVAVRDSAAGAGAVTAFSFEHQGELDQFKDLQKKVIPSADDREDRARLLGDAQLMNSFRSLLSSQVLEPQALQDQNLALDLLFEGLRDHNADAVAVLQSVVQDAQVENPALPQKVRENLAGLKAEALFQMSAANPSQAPALQAMLPGPVSQRIWANVVARQKSNLAESALEVKSR